MWAFLGKRLAFSLVSIWAIATITFFMAYLAPGDPAAVRFGDHSNPQTVAAWKHAHGLDMPAVPRYVRYLSNVCHGDLGTSLYDDEKISDILKERFPVTALLAVVSIVIALLVGVTVGIIAALVPGTWLDRSLMAFMITCVSLPNFVIAPLLVLVFTLRMGALPSSGWGGIAYMIMPVMVLAARPAANIARMTRGSLLEVLRQEYIRTARAKGLSPYRIILVHALKPALLPVITTAGVSFGYLLAGSFVVENIFSIPGVGNYSVISFSRRDYALIQGVTVLLAIIFVAINTVIDVLYRVLDPRARAAGTEAGAAS